ncbi:FAD-dependent monooxygenase [Actinomadura sp. NAK00032]|uniref:FAD-dependent monooxygenase n=1 Tax=Actinomadura sp. NAK00032 TaxID=2742128 RepID=UPI0015918B08|nr:FAD-dependent monooxygenase [Actinomadura sp. NAK00032]QKW37313.1 FAD-dependent monooxygenase [Actinomadura sp. NAK00032]
MRVLINGGGVAGLTLAFWLRRHGIEPVVVERAAHGRLGGYGIDFFGTGYDVAARMGIVDRLAPHRLPVDSVDFVDAAGRPGARLTAPLLDKVIQGPHLALMHTTLEGALLDAVEGDVEIRFGETVTAVRDTGSAVEAEFAGGTTERFDLLVGADGIHSRTRELAFGPEPEFARYLGCRLACFPVADRYDWGRARVHYTEPGRQVVVYPTGRTGELIALFLFRSSHTGNVPRAERPGLLRSTFGGMGWLTPSLLAEAPADEPIFMDTMTQIVMPAWHRGRVALVGDACGCMTMVSAQGVSMAMAGAYVLAEELARHGDHVGAFTRYQERVRAEVAHRQRNAQMFIRTLVPGTRPGLVAQSLIQRLIMREAFAPLLRRQFGASSFLPPQNPEPRQGVIHGDR